MSMIIDRSAPLFVPKRDYSKATIPLFLSLALLVCVSCIFTGMVLAKPLQDWLHGIYGLDVIKDDWICYGSIDRNTQVCSNIAVEYVPPKSVSNTERRVFLDFRGREFIPLPYPKPYPEAIIPDGTLEDLK